MVSNMVDAVLSSNATLTVLAPPTIITQPTNQTVYVGGTASFSVTASGTLPLSYQWNFNQTNIANATNATLVLTNVQLNQAGNLCGAGDQSRQFHPQFQRGADGQSAADTGSDDIGWFRVDFLAGKHAGFCAGNFQQPIPGKLGSRTQSAHSDWQRISGVHPDDRNQSILPPATRRIAGVIYDILTLASFTSW